MFSGLDIPLRVTGGERVNWDSGRLDLLMVDSSQVTQLGNFIIRRAAMFTFCPITIINGVQDLLYITQSYL